MVNQNNALSACLSYPQWLEQQNDTPLLQTHFDDGSSVVFSLLTHETSMAGSAEAETANTEVKPT